MEFDPRNNVIQLCVQGMAMEEKGSLEEARGLFLRAWNEAQNDYEKFIAAHFAARHREHLSDELKWHETALQSALKINDVTVQSAFPSLYSNIARCYEKLGDRENAAKNYELADSFRGTPTDKGPFYHGTKADMQVGELLTAGSNSNYKDELVMNHIYFTALANGAGLAASIGQGRRARARLHCRTNRHI